MFFRKLILILILGVFFCGCGSSAELYTWHELNYSSCILDNLTVDKGDNSLKHGFFADNFDDGTLDWSNAIYAEDGTMVSSSASSYITSLATVPDGFVLPLNFSIYSDMNTTSRAYVAYGGTGYTTTVSGGEYVGQYWNLNQGYDIIGATNTTDKPVSGVYYGTRIDVSYYNETHKQIKLYVNGTLKTTAYSSFAGNNIGTKQYAGSNTSHYDNYRAYNSDTTTGILLTPATDSGFSGYPNKIKLLRTYTGGSVKIEINSSSDNSSWSGWATVTDNATTDTEYDIPVINQDRYYQLQITSDIPDIHTTDTISSISVERYFNEDLVPLTISYTPETLNISKFVNATQQFEITASKTCNVSWYVNDILQQTNTSVFDSEYTLPIASPIEYNVTAYVEAGLNNTSQTWHVYGNDAYYVSNTGNNSNTGTQFEPFANISYAITQAHDGNTIRVNSGTYNEQIKLAQSIAPRLHIIGIGDTKPIITYNGSLATVEFGTHASVSPNATGHVLQNLDIRNTGDISDDNGKGVIFSYNANTTDCMIENCNISTVRRGVHISVGTHTNATIKDCNIHTQKTDGIKSDTTGLSTINILNNNIWAAESWFYGTASSGMYLNKFSNVNVTGNNIWISGYTGIKPGLSTGIYLNNTIHENGYAHNAFETGFSGVVLRGNQVLGHNVTQQSGSTKSGNVFYSAGQALCSNASVYDFYSNNTRWTLCAIGGHTSDFYIENFTANNHDGYGFRVFGYSANAYPVEKYTSDNITFKNCTINPIYTTGSYSPVQIVCPGTNTTENPSPYYIQNETGFTRDKIAFINFKMGGNYQTGYHNWDITDIATDSANKHHHGDVKIINSMGVDDIYFKIGHPINCTTTTEVMYYADIKLQNGTGTAIPNKTVTWATTAVNPETLTTLTPVNVNASSGQKSYVDTLSSTTTDTNGRTPLPSNISHTIAITDFVKNKAGSTDVIWSVDADGVILENINPDENWYRSEQDTSKYTITAIKNSSENTHITGFAPSVEENTFSAGDEVTYQVWLSEDADSISWKKNGVEVATDTLTYRDTFSTDPVVMSFSATDANGDVSYTWDYNPEALPVAEFTANVTSGTVPLTVQFTDLSENALSWYWDFDNDGTVDNSTQNPEYIYSTAGTYTVNLTVQNGENADSEVKELYISVESPSIINSYWNSFWAWWGMRWQVTYWLQEAV